MERVFILIDFAHNEYGTMFDPKDDEEEYCNECNETFNDKIVRAVVVEMELFCDNDEYKWTNHKDPICDGIYRLCCGVAGPVPHKKMELEAKFFTSTCFSRNDLGYNSDPGTVHPEVTKETKRSRTSTVSKSRQIEFVNF